MSECLRTPASSSHARALAFDQGGAIAIALTGKLVVIMSKFAENQAVRLRVTLPRALSFISVCLRDLTRAAIHYLVTTLATVAGSNSWS